MLNSNDTEEKTDNDDALSNSKELLYDYIEDTVNKALVYQKKFIMDSVKSLQTNEKVAFEAVCDFKEYFDDSIDDLRQDLIPNGILPDWNEKEIWKILPLIGSETTFDVKQEYNIRNYLNKCLIIAHTINPIFQANLATILDEIKSKLNIDNILYQSAPVKLGERCIVKSQIDYGDKQWPSCANIADYIRASCTFDSAQDMIDVMNQLLGL